MKEHNAWEREYLVGTADNVVFRSIDFSEAELRVTHDVSNLGYRNQKPEDFKEASNSYLSKDGKESLRAVCHRKYDRKEHHAHRLDERFEC